MKRFVTFLATIGCLVCLLTIPAAADVNDFTITDFSADETLSNTDSQGQLHIVEHISVDFTDQNHGILRAIPQSYKGVPLKLHVNSVISKTGAPAGYTSYISNSNTVLKIGDANVTVTGPQEYSIDYTISNVISFYNGHDELYWDVNGDQWGQPVNDVSVVLHLPSDAKLSNQKPVCYAGAYGSTTSNCSITVQNNTLNSAASDLLPAQTLSYVIGFQKGYFKPEPLASKFLRYAKPVIELLALPIVFGGFSFSYWWRRGRDAKGSVVIIPMYDAPDNLTPIEVGTVIDFKVDNRDITSIIIDLALRGYVKIIESSKDRLIGKDKLSYTLELRNADMTNLKSYEALMLTTLFTSLTVGSLVDLSSMKSKFYTTAKTITSSVENDLTAGGYFRSNPLNASGPTMVIAVILFFLLFFIGHILGGLLIASVVLTLGIVLLFASKMSARTVKGVAAKEHILGLKLYLQVAEAERIKMLQSPNAAYAANAHEPVRTVELFEKLLPYAMVLGVENEWAKQFNDIYTQPPDWYSGNWSAFNTGLLIGNLNSGFSSSFNSAFSAPSSSGSSGFGGGGFSGGGGGGGGGGGW